MATKNLAHPSTKGGNSWVVLDVLGVMKDASWVMEMAGLGWNLGLELVYLGSSRQVGLAILAQGIQDLESREAVLQHCGLYDMCGHGRSVQLDFEIALNSPARAGGMQISRDG